MYTCDTISSHYSHQHLIWNPYILQVTNKVTLPFYYKELHQDIFLSAHCWQPLHNVGCSIVITNMDCGNSMMLDYL